MVTRLPNSNVTDVRITEIPRFYSASGYGRKIPTQYMVRAANRWLRVYCVQYSNAGSVYVLRNGEMLFLEIETENRLEIERDRFYRAISSPL